ncbi:UNVERIFIED_CONTAM: putative ribonuclease H protein [Sesamum latifolium]|uniref:Ribonuclease H protein n=1 Tax=Sesamum latifolium TaxID=2727402 RepID=A0AAW2X420_9LAMI
MNTDGASKGNPGISGAGGILRDQLGRVIFAFQEPLGNITNTQAELQAIHRGLQICIDRGFRNVWIETDATLSSSSSPLHNEGHGTSKQFSKVSGRFYVTWSIKSLIFFEKEIKRQTTSQTKHVTHNNRAYFLRTPSQLLLGDFRTVFCAVSVAPFGAVFGAGGGVFWGRLRAGLIAVVLPLLQRYAAADLYCRCYFIAAARGLFYCFYAFVAHLGAVSGAVWGLVLGLFGDYFWGRLKVTLRPLCYYWGLQLGGCFGAVSGAGWDFLGQLRTFYLLFLGFGAFRCIW